MKLLVLLALCGCDAVFGFDHVKLPPEPDAPPGATRTVDCDFMWNVVTLDAAGLPQVDTRPPPPNYVHVLLGSAEIPMAADGTFSFTVPADAPYELTVVEGGSTLYFDRDSASCHLVTDFFHRLNGVPASVSTPLRLDVAGPTPMNAGVFIASAGIRTFSTATFSMTNSWTVDWLIEKEADGTPASLLQNEPVIWEYWPLSPDYYSVQQVATANVTLTNGMFQAVTVTPTNLPLRCVHIASNEGQLAALLSAATLRAPGTLAAGWAITSQQVPSVAVGENEPLALTRRADIADHNVAVVYGNPFAGEADLFQVGVSIEHAVAAPGVSSAKIYSQVVAWDLVAADAGCTTTVTTAVPPVAIGNGAMIAAQPLQADGDPITIDRAHPVPVHVSLVDGPRDDVVVSVDEVVAAGSTTAFVPVATYFPLDTDFTIAPALLQKGHTYLLQLQVRSGFPGAHVFDYRTTAYPRTISVNPTTTFSIAN